ncbi:MAG: VOC family protein [Ginsengibacter sp.]
MGIKGKVKGLHHITATVNDAQEDYYFYTKTLGLRLVKETVNFDNEKVYHFYYANKIGSPSTVFTTFPYKGQGVREGVIGAGQATHTAFSVPSASVGFWKDRLTKSGKPAKEGVLFGLETLDFKDPSGLNIQIMGVEDDQREPVWKFDDITEKEAVRGMHHAILTVMDAREAMNFLEIFGYEVKKEEEDMTLLEAGTGGAGNTLILRSAPHTAIGINGLGTVHHVAHRVDSLEDSLEIKAFLESRMGIMTTEVLDRKYFQSIYFRIPGGVLFEIATSGPGFTVDESEADLGTGLKLPDWQEPQRGRIEENLLKYKK